jgi:hypothetical protein
MENEMSGRIPARTAMLAVALLASTAGVAVMAATASAIPTAGASLSLKADGLSELSVHPLYPSLKIAFETEYDAEAYYGAVKCKGKHEADEKAGYPGVEKEGGRDVEHCKSTTGKPLVGLTPGETVELGKGWFPGSSGWDSDYDGQAASEIEYTVSSTGKSFRLVAYYPFPA